MGNESSVEMEGGTLIQSQGEEHLWSLHLHRESEIEGEGVCVFSRKPTKGAQTELCRAGIEVGTSRFGEQGYSIYHLSP